MGLKLALQNGFEIQWRTIFRPNGRYGNAITMNTLSEMNNPIKPFQNTLLIIRPNGRMINFGAKSLEFKRVYNVNHSDNKDYIKNNPKISKS